MSPEKLAHILPEQRLLTDLTSRIPLGHEIDSNPDNAKASGLVASLVNQSQRRSAPLKLSSADMPPMF